MSDILIEFINKMQNQLYFMQIFLFLCPYYRVINKLIF